MSWFTVLWIVGYLGLGYVISKLPWRWGLIGFTFVVIGQTGLHFEEQKNLHNERTATLDAVDSIVKECGLDVVLIDEDSLMHFGVLDKIGVMDLPRRDYRIDSAYHLIHVYEFPSDLQRKLDSLRAE